MFNKVRATAARVLFAILVVATPSQAGSGVQLMKSSSSEPTVQSTVVLGSVVAVTVANPTRSTVVVLVTVTAVVDGLPVVSAAVGTVPPRDDATVDVGFSGPVGSVVTVGLQEDSGPI